MTIRAASLSHMGRNALFQFAASNKTPVSMGATTTSSLQGASGELERQIHGYLPADARALFGLPHDDPMAFEG
eukprot:1044728-Lingulodinium_polyedra.AAC.1